MTSEFPLIEPTWHVAHQTAHTVAAALHSQHVPVAHAVGRVLATDVRSLIDLPLDTTSAMDGWAVGGSRGPWRVLDGHALAGHVSQVTLTPDAAVLIATGGVIPAGTFGVVRREFAEMYGDGVGSFVRATHEAEPFANSHVRPSGDEAKRDEILMPAGTRLSPAHTALAAMAGYDTLEVRCAVSCEILVLGDEVLRSGIPRSGQVRDAFEPQFAAYAALLGLEVTGFRFIPDTLEATTEALATSTARVVISTGGTAAGPKDFLHSALTSVGAQMVIDSIAMRPGHPNLLAQRGNQFFVGLPGNPLSASLGGMLTLVRPLACGLLGMPLPELTSALTSTPFKAPAHDTRLVPVTVENRSGTIFVTELPWLNSGMMRGLANADAVAVIPPGGVGEQEVVEVLALAW